MIKYLGYAVTFQEIPDEITLCFNITNCKHHCPGCHNEGLWDPDGGYEFTEKSMKELLELLDRHTVDGLTLSGGDPMYSSNRNAIFDIVKTVKEKTGKNIWMYTGYYLEDIVDEPALQFIDVIVDGRYRRQLPPTKWAGSNNQKVWRKEENGSWSTR